jgi:hypothetical protein
MVTTHALFAMKVQHKLRNGVAGRIISGSAESGQNLPISAMLLDPQNVRAEMPAEIDQLGIAGAAAQTRMVSAGEFWPSQQELSRDLKYMARARIPEFESYMPSHAVVSPGMRGVMSAPFGLARHLWADVARASIADAHSPPTLETMFATCDVRHRAPPSL